MKSYQRSAFSFQLGAAALIVAAACYGQNPPSQAQAPAQTPAAAPAKPDDKAAAQTPAPAAAAPAAPAANPAPTGEEWFNGSIDFGYRWISDIRGSLAEYRSVVDLGEGPKLFGLDFTIQDPKKRLFDRIDAQAYGWGDEPYTTTRLRAVKHNVYDLNIDYRNIAYFNAVPSFANPQAPLGFDQQSFDIRRRLATARLDLRPGKRITPYLAYEHNSGYGNGIDDWVQDANNSFAVPTTLYDSTNNYRGGIRFEYNKFQVTLEQGGTTFKENDQAYWNGINLGNRTAPLLGVTSVLTGLVQAYGIRGTSFYQRGLFTARPKNWIDLYGQFLFSQPNTSVSYKDVAYGQFADITTLLLFTGQQTAATGVANQPHTSANAGFELRPWRRVRIIESWMTDRYHDAASSLVIQQLFTVNITNANALTYGQFVNYNQQQTDVLFDVNSKLMVRGGYRLVWGDATVLAGVLSPTGNLVSGQLRRNVMLGGAAFRPTQKISSTVDYEGAWSDHIYFRTSLNSYERARARIRYQPTTTLTLQGNFTILNNQNPAPDIRYDFQSRTNSFTTFWTPAKMKGVTIMGEYDRSTVRSDIIYLGLFLVPSISSYRDNAHTATSAIDVPVSALNGAKFTIGGSLFISSGSRPTRYYQPLARVLVPIVHRLDWYAEWRYYGFGEAFYLYEGFRTHMLQTGFRVTK
jgi:hypothetical protein